MLLLQVLCPSNRNKRVQCPTDTVRIVGVYKNILAKYYLLLMTSYIIAGSVYTHVLSLLLSYV